MKDNTIKNTTKNITKNKSKSKKVQSGPKELLSFTKKLVLFVLILSEFEILLSYVLAFLGKEMIAESLSSQVVITCLGGLGFYCLKALVENISKYTTFFNRGSNTVRDNENNNDSDNDNDNVINNVNDAIDECNDIINK